jgi:ribonuclease T
MPDPEVFISVDVEASGPTPASGSLISIGACRVDDPDSSFYVELWPVPGVPWDVQTERIHGLTPEHLAEHGMAPDQAVRRFGDWIASVAPGARSVMLGFNAAFDWLFIADAFQRYLGRNPFGIAPLDLKALYMGRLGIERWAETSKHFVIERLGVTLPHTHNALDDARMQAEVARGLGIGGDGARPGGAPVTGGG